MSLIRSGAARSTEVLSGNLEFFTMFTTIDITCTGDYADITQKDFEAIIQVIGLRAIPVLMNEPVLILSPETLADYGAPTLNGDGWILKFAFERQGVHTITTLTDELHGIVLNGGIVDTKNSVNTEFTKQDLL